MFPFSQIVVLGLSAVAGQESKGPQWTMLALEIEKKVEDAEVNLHSGTKVVAALHLPGKNIVGVDWRESALLSFKDDKNTNLLQDPVDQRFTFSGLIEDELRITTDCQHCRVAYQAPGWPVAGATQVRIKGNLVVLVGKDEKHLEIKDVVPVLGIDLPCGKMKMGKAISLSDLSFTGNRPLKSLVLLDKDGKELPFKYSGNFKGGPVQSGNQVDYRYSGRFYLPRRNLRCTVRVSYFDAVEKIVVPVDIQTRLGF